MNKIPKILFAVLFTLMVIVLASLSIKGDHNRYDLHHEQDLGGPFEASNSRGRYMLVQAIVDSGTFFLNKDQAAFSLPDLAIIHGKYVSIFTPGVTFLGVPFYLLGKAIGFPQATTYALNFLVGIINIFLVYKLARKLGASKVTALISGFLFLFGTNSLSYSTTFTQHPLSAMLILLAMLNVFEKRTLTNNILLGYWFGLSVTIDIPNLVLFVPVLIYAVFQHFQLEKTRTSVLFSLNPRLFALALGALPFLAGFAWYNHQLTGSYTAVPQLLGRTTTLEPKPAISLTPPSTLPFAARHFALDSRNLIRGVYTLVFSSERSWLYYSPFLVFGLIGLIVAARKNEMRSFASLCLAAGVTNLLVYMLFGDPWGGWAFGPRYLIPGAAIFASGTGVFLDRIVRHRALVILSFLVCLYSVAISLAGSLTTNLIPPKVEAVAMPEPVPYNFTYNFQLLFEKNISGSLIFNTYLSPYLTASHFYIASVVLTALPLLGLFIVLLRRRHV